MNKKIICISILVIIIICIVLTIIYFTTKKSLTLQITSSKSMITDESYEKANSSIKQILKENNVLLYKIQNDKENSKITIIFKNKSNFSLKECLNDKKTNQHDIYFQGSSKTSILSNSEIKDIEYSEEPIDSSGKKAPHIIIKFTEEGKIKFTKLTEENIGKAISIYFDGKLLAAPIVYQKIESETAIVTFGNKSFEENKTEAQNIVKCIKNSLLQTFPFDFE